MNRKIIGMLLVACMVAFFGCKKDDSVSGSGEGETKECFYFEAEEGGVVVSMEKYSKYESKVTAPDVSLEYSQNKVDWSPFVVGETNVTLAKAGDRVYIRAKEMNEIFYSCLSDEYGNPYWAYNRFTASGRVKAGGNIMYLLDGTGSKNELDTVLNKYTFFSLFEDMETLTDASKLALPAMTLAESCYEGMFAGCTSLTAAPALPAMTLAEDCYECMFLGCTSLTAAPTLPATALAEGCYIGMFDHCTSLTAAPALPAMTLAEWCYCSMFRNCTSLTVAPELPATTLAPCCYVFMFEGCSLLQNIEVNFTDWSNNETDGWLEGVSATGTFTCPAELDVTERGSSRIPEGWTIVTK